MTTKLVRVTFDAVKGHETDNGVCYYTSNDKTHKETILRRSQIVQETELGLIGTVKERESNIRRLEKARRAAALAGNTTRVLAYDDRIDQMYEALRQVRTQDEKIARERYEYGVVINGRVSITTYDQWVDNVGEGYETVRRPVGEWETHEQD